MNNLTPQFNLFGDLQAKDIPVDVVAIKIGASIATIRNWIKTGYLVKNNRGLIETSSLDKLLREVAGKEKLNSRANKS